LCAETAGLEQQPLFVPERPGDLRHSLLDPSRAGRARLACQDDGRGWRRANVGLGAGSVGAAARTPAPTPCEKSR
jgi:hypothetical protein